MKQQDLFGPRSPAPSEKAGEQGDAQRPEPKPAEPPRKVAAAPEKEPLPAPRVPAWRQGRPEPKVLSVSELTFQLKELIEPRFSRVLVRGEVTGFRGPNARGHLYFSIKDERASIEVRLWATAARTLKFKLKDGLSVIIEGSLDVYEVQGRYSVIAQRIEPEGVGARALAFEQLKAKLAAEGLLGDRRTKPRRALPLLPRRVGVVTSVSGAALRDFLKVLHRRHPRLPVLVADARVQGDGAAWEVRRAIRALCRTDVDVIVVTRGGGSVDDLWTFNEEPVARAIFEAPVPVVSAVGHEIDTTLADLVADLRAPTPSAAAEAVAPVLSELELGLRNARARLTRAVEKTVLSSRTQLKALRGELGDPRRALSGQRLWLADVAEKLSRTLRRSVREGEETLERLGARLQAARPQAQLEARRAAFEALERRLFVTGPRLVREQRAALARLSLELERASPRPALGRARQALAHDAARLPGLARHRVRGERQRLTALAQRLDALSPLKVLGRGYAIASRAADGQVVRRATDVQVGDRLRVRLAQDEVEARVTGLKPGGK
ncbi:MAG: exodeoxyribonuclease VII large subunit [Myxococcota bacterium]